ncbi:MAG: penicillin-binding protein 1C [Chlorobi bacterium]|nr:penicillin-binding protein 1C [Chlorobiota bacterium]
MWLTAAVVLLFIGGWIILPRPLFTDGFSTVVLDRKGRLLGAKVASDGQWRFSDTTLIPKRFETCILSFEDRYFYYHPGINPISVFTSLRDNIMAGKIVRGASTISMQVMRIARKGKARSIKEKAIEGIMALGLELTHTKKEILELYCANAPFGGNVVGLSAASWRYFKRPAGDLSWAESATLAVLPNAPALIHPGRNRSSLRKKRDKLLKNLMDQQIIDSLEYELAVLEEIPDKLKDLEQTCPHLLQKLEKSGKGLTHTTTIDVYLQKMVNSALSGHANSFQDIGINNAAVIISYVKTGEVLAYAGNISSTTKLKIKDEYNDMAMANRSTGSILKPFLYAAMLDEGSILPNSLVRDIPSYFDNYSPQNYNGEFQGAVPASQALARSLNVPAVYMLQEYGIARFLYLLNKLGFKSFNKSADYYGLSLILGGGETSLYELVGAYTSMARTLRGFDDNYGKYPRNAYQPLRLELADKLIDTKMTEEPGPLHASSIWLCYDALKKVSRPETEAGWENFGSSSQIAWKTGTSHGYKDAWAIGTTADYVVGVWVGNADGEGRNGLSGTKTAAPLMFDIFNNLKQSTEFYPPYDELQEIEVCKRSGLPASRFCEDTELIDCGLSEQSIKVCTYHKHIFTDKNKEYRLSRQCADDDGLMAVNWFVLPPVQEYYYKKKHPAYLPLPPYRSGCGETGGENSMDFMYPTSNSTIFVSHDENNKAKEIIFELSHHDDNATIYWHLDDKLIGITKRRHQLPFVPASGKHKLTAVDQGGEYKSVVFTVLR